MIRVEVSDRYGTVAEIVDPKDLSPSQRRRIDTAARMLVGDIARLLGCDEEHARNVALADLTRLVADETAYERVAERRGVLPL